MPADLADRTDFDNANRGLVGGPEQGAVKTAEGRDEGNRFLAAELASHAVFADPGSAEARDVLAAALTRLAFGSECATWRNCFLKGATELRDGIAPTPLSASAGMARAMSITQLFDTPSPSASTGLAPRARPCPCCGTSPTAASDTSCSCPTACSSTTRPAALRTPISPSGSPAPS